MSFLSDYATETDENNQLLQRVMRDIDDRMFLAFMSGLSEAERGIIYRNMSKRAAEAVLADLDEKKGFYPPDTISYASSLFERMLGRQRRYLALKQQATESWQQPDGNPEHSRNIMLYLALATDEDRYPEIKEHEAECQDPMLKLALRLLHDNHDPLSARSQLEQLKKALLHSYEQHLDVIIEGSDSILNNEVYGRTSERLDVLLGKV